MRVLLRLLAPLLGLVVAAAGVLLVIEVVSAWVRPAAGPLVPWPQWRASLDELAWHDGPVPLVAIGVAVVGLLLVLLGAFARRHDIALDAPAPGTTVTTSPSVLARLVGRRVRAADDVAAASVTASRRRVTVAAQGWGEPGPELRLIVTHEVDELLRELPLARRPRVAVSVRGRRGPR